jgi:hypothetical protein
MGEQAYVESITPSRTTGTEGEFIDFTLAIVAEGTDTVYEGDLVIEVDGNTVYNEENYTVGWEPQQVQVPIKFGESGGHDVCATLLNPEPIDVM